VIQKMRRIPFSLKGKVTALVSDFLVNDVIKRVEGPTTGGQSGLFEAR